MGTCLLQEACGVGVAFYAVEIDACSLGKTVEVVHVVGNGVGVGSQACEEAGQYSGAVPMTESI